MALSETALVREYVLSWLEHLSSEVGFTEGAFGDIRREEVDLADVMSALETSNVARATKENSHDAFFSLVGTTCDGVALGVTVSIDPYARGVCVHRVQRM